VIQKKKVGKKGKQNTGADAKKTHRATTSWGRNERNVRKGEDEKIATGSAKKGQIGRKKGNMDGDEIRGVEAKINQADAKKRLVGVTQNSQCSGRGDVGGPKRDVGDQIETESGLTLQDWQGGESIWFDGEGAGQHCG